MKYESTIFKKILIQPISKNHPYPKEEFIKAFESFCKKLSKAVQKAGGTGDASHIGSLMASPFEYTFYHLFPNGIEITFKTKRKHK
jgi:hypothetical protein